MTMFHRAEADGSNGSSRSLENRPIQSLDTPVIYSELLHREDGSVGKALPCKFEDPSSDSQNPHEKYGHSGGCL